jgi:hypothetical protein
MATQRFDDLYKKLLQEATPVVGDLEGFSGGLKSGIESSPGNAYLIGDLANALGKSKVEIIDLIADDLYKKVFGDEGVNPANSEEEYRDAIANAISDIVKELKSKNPDLKVPGAKAIAGYTARIVAKLGQVTRDFSGQASEDDIHQAVTDASGEEDEERGEQGDDADGTENEELPITSDDEEIVAGQAPDVAEEPTRPFSSEGTYELQDVKAGLLKGEANDAYQALSRAGASDGAEGSEISDVLKRAGITVSKIGSVINTLIRNRALVRTDSPAGGGAEAPEGPVKSDDKEWIKNYLKGTGALDDYQKSGGGYDHGVDFG